MSESINRYLTFCPPAECRDEIDANTFGTAVAHSPIMGSRKTGSSSNDRGIGTAQPRVVYDGVVREPDNQETAAES